MAFYSINPQNAALTNGADILRRYTVDANKTDHPSSYYDKERASSYLGTPVLSSLLIKPGSYQLDNGQIIDYDGIFIDNVLMTVTRPKVIQKTQITGRAGTIKEYIADGDYEVSLTIQIASPSPDLFPAEAVSRLLNILKAPVSVSVVSEFLNLYDVNTLVFERDSLEQRAGFSNLANFTISALSDEPLELQVLNI